MRLAEILGTLDRTERKQNAIARFKLPDALRDLDSEAGPQPVQILFFQFAFSFDPSQLRRRLRQYFPKEVVRDVTIDGRSIYTER
jgi:hypothetical protein